MKEDMKIAVLIDADNISNKYVKILLDEVANVGIATYKRIYGDWTDTRLSSWKKELLDNSIVPIQQYGYTTGKNSTDSAMIIDAMDILYSGNVDGFCIVSSDSDFTRLVSRLRESGMLVIGMGESKTPKPFISACNQFKYLDLLAETAKIGKAPAKPLQTAEPKKNNVKVNNNTTAKSRAKNKPDTKAQTEAKKQADLKAAAEAAAAEAAAKTAAEAAAAEAAAQAQAKAKVKKQDAFIQQEIIKIIEENSDEDGWLFSGVLGNLLAKRYPDFDVRNYGFKKLIPFIESFHCFEVKRNPSKEDNSVKLIYIRVKE